MRNLLIPVLIFSISLLVTAVVVGGGGGQAPRDPKTFNLASSAGPNVFYPSNRPPLSVSPLVKLPIGAVEPKGWLLRQLQLMRDGFTGRLAEISKFLGSDSGWVTLQGKGWEELPYWLKGYGDLGYLLKDPAVRKQTERWLNYALKSQQPDGYFGPVDNKNVKDSLPTDNKGAPDLWP